MNPRKTNSESEENKEKFSSTPLIPFTPKYNDEEDNKLSNEFMKSLHDSEDVILKNDSSKSVSLTEANQIMERLAKTKEITKQTAIIACAALFRRGAANAGAPDTMEVEVQCANVSKGGTIIQRYDVVMALYSVCNHKTLRKLAETLAPSMLATNLRLVKQNPLLDLKGDLANRINRKLSLRKKDPLTREEEICCATYAQWMPNLNEICGSTRLKSLLDEDLNVRRKNKNKTKSPKKQTQQNQSDSKKTKK